MKYVVVTGGTCHGIGKGIITSVVSYILQQSGLNVTNIKFDGLLNRLGKEPYHKKIDVLYEGEETFILDDGFIADSDFGSYERFLNKELKRKNNILNGDCWFDLLNIDYKTGEILKIRPHLINIYKKKIEEAASGNDAVVIEVGGTVGDNENIFFLQALKDIKSGNLSNFLSLHVTYIPGNKYPEVKNVVRYISDDFILKPAKQSILKLGEYGLDPDIVVCRCHVKLSDIIKERISEATGISKNYIFSDEDVENIYSIVESFKKQKIDTAIFKRLNIKFKEKRGHIDNYLSKIKKINKKIRVIILGNTEGWDSYISLSEAIDHAAVDLGYKSEIKWISNKAIDEKLKKETNGFIITEGLEDMKEKFSVAKYCRENSKPILGISAGSQIILAEYVKNKLKLVNLFQELNKKRNSLILKKNMRIGGQNTKVFGYLKDVYGRNFIRGFK